MDKEYLIKEAEHVQKLAWRGYCNIDTNLMTIEQAQKLNAVEFSKTMRVIETMGSLIRRYETC